MDKLLALMAMIFFHFLADYHLQGVLANMKQYEWWKKQVENYENSMYRNDYKAALVAHSFEWAFIMMLPLLYEIYHECWNFEHYSVLAAGAYVGLLIVNTIVHCIVDNAKANRKTINLVKDQSIHLVQVFLTWLIFVAATWKLFLFY
jgi:archaellum biogenesis protein FlaJ (TadC family)